MLVVRLRSIGDTVLATPSLDALRRFLPDAEVDILLEDWVAPLLEGCGIASNVITTGRSKTARFRKALEIRRRRYDAVFNLHGGTTSGFFTAASHSPNRIGYAGYRFPYFYNHKLGSSAEFWQRKATHSAEQQLALLGFAGVPVGDRPPSRLVATQSAFELLKTKLNLEGEAEGSFRMPDGRMPVLLHPAAATHTKQWAAPGFAAVADHVFQKGFHPVAVAAPGERRVLDSLVEKARHPITVRDDLSLPEITALASASRLFVGNDSGIAHIAAAVGTRPVVIFGSSNRDHWRPWTEGPSRVVFKPFDCQPCAGVRCESFSSPRCILEMDADQVLRAVDDLLNELPLIGR